MTRCYPFIEAAPAARIEAGLPAAIDAVAERAAPGHRFLRRGWYAAAVETYGGSPRTLVVEAGAVPALAMPLVPVGPRLAGLAAVPGSYWPFRAPVSVENASPQVFAAAVAALGRAKRAVRIGPAVEGDPGVVGLVTAAETAGWTVATRRIGATWVLDMAAAGDAWPRGSSLRKNRFHEKHLGAHGALDWGWLAAADWPTGFDALASIEARSWQGDERDAKFSGRHGAFWRAAARDPVVAGAMRAALLRVDGVPAAFSFDMEAGALTYAIANSYVADYAKHSPGKLLQYRNLLDARGRGVRVVDWGVGDSGYKQTLGAVEGPPLNDWLLIAPRVPRSIARIVAKRWRSSGRA